MVEETVIKLVVGFAMNKDDFSEELQNVFIEALSEVTLIPSRHIEITSIDSIANTTNGSALVSGIRVAVEFAVENVTQGGEISTHMTPMILNTKIAEKGLPTMKVLVSATVETVMKPPAVVTETPESTKQFVFGMLLSVLEFRVKQLVFKRALASAFVVSVEKINITSVTLVYAVSNRRLLATEIEVGAEVRFPSLAQSQTPVPLFAINDALMLHGLPVATVVTNPKTPVVVKNDGTPSTAGNFTAVVLYTIAAFMLVLVVLVITIIIMIIICICRSCSKHRTNAASSYPHSAPRPRDQNNGIFDVVSGAAFSPYAVSCGENNYMYNYIDPNANAYAC